MYREMTVRDLIAELSEYNPDARVVATVGGEPRRFCLTMGGEKGRPLNPSNATRVGIHIECSGEIWLA